MSLLRQFDLNLLVILEALITECHVSRAADKVFLSQSAMSHALNRLREQLDDPLLIRYGQGLKPSPKALEMLPEIQTALRLIEHQLSPPAPFDPAKTERTFTLAVTDFVETVILPELLPILIEQAPRIRFSIEMIGMNYSQDALAALNTDLVIGLHTESTLSEGLIATPWLTEHYAIIANQTRLNTHITTKEYIQATHINVVDTAGEKNYNGDPIDLWLANNSLKRDSLISTVNYFAAAKMVTQTHSLMTLPKRMAKLFSQHMPLTIVTPPADFPVLNMSIIRHTLHRKNPAINWLQDQFISYESGL